MKKLTLLCMVIIMATNAFASEKSDTTIVMNGKTIVIQDNGNNTSVQILEKDGATWKKLSETMFVDSQEVERVYVTSPFFPTKNRSTEFKSHYPAIFLGRVIQSESILSMNSADVLHARDSKSNEWGITLGSLSLGLAHKASSAWGITAAMQWGYVHNHYSNDYVMDIDNDNVIMRSNTATGVKKSYMSYKYLRVPVMLEWESNTKHKAAFVGVGPTVELRYGEHARYKSDGKHTTTTDLNMKPFVFGLYAHAGYGDIQIYASTSLTRIFDTSVSPEIYPFCFGIGIGL